MGYQRREHGEYNNNHTHNMKNFVAIIFVNMVAARPDGPVGHHGVHTGVHHPVVSHSISHHQPVHHAVHHHQPIHHTVHHQPVHHAVPLTACRRRSPPWLPCPPSSRCGSPSRSTTSAAPPLSTASASKRIILSPPKKQMCSIRIYFCELFHKF